VTDRVVVRNDGNLGVVTDHNYRQWLAAGHDANHLASLRRVLPVHRSHHALGDAPHDGPHQPRWPPL